MHDDIISLRGEVWAYKTSLTSALFIEVLVPKLVVLILTLFLRFLIRFTLELICGICCFSYYKELNIIHQRKKADLNILLY